MASAISKGLQSTTGMERMIAALTLAKWSSIRQNSEQMTVIAQLAQECQNQLMSGSVKPATGFIEIEYLCRGIRPRLVAVLNHLAAAGWNSEVIDVPSFTLIIHALTWLLSTA